MTNPTKRNGVTIPPGEPLPTEQEIDAMIGEVSAALAALGLHCAPVADVQRVMAERRG